MGRYIKYSFIIVLCIPSLLSAQSDTLSFPEVEITGKKGRDLHIGSSNTVWTRELIRDHPAQSLADLLEQNTGVHIKGYGLGSLSTSSIRGGNAAQTLVLWNGIPLQSPMLGQLDFSLIPPGIAEEIGLQLGGGSASWGSGAIGGILSLSNIPDFSNQLDIRSKTTLGSFGYFDQQFRLTLGNNKIQSHTKVFTRLADNDFTYSQGAGLTERKQTNAELSQQNILQDVFWKIDDRYRLAAHFWYQISSRQIPANNEQNFSEALQDDESMRFILEGKRVYRQVLLQSKLSYTNEHLDYYDFRSGFDSFSQFKTWTGELESQWSWNKIHRFSAGMSYAHTRAWSDGYQERVTEDKISAFAGYHLELGSLHLQSRLRKEMVNAEWIPWIPSLGVDYTLLPFLKLSSKISRNYRLPTLNDRFWWPGGNPDLKAESGWSQEGSIHIQLESESTSFTYTLTGFNRRIDNWILWTPGEDVLYWKATNVAEVWSRGIEQRISLDYNPEPWSYHFHTGYDIIRSTSEVDIPLPRLRKGEQLIYVPERSAFGEITVSRNDLSLTYRHQYTGDSRGISETIAAFHVGQIRAKYSMGIHSFHVDLFIDVNNIWNEDYFVVEKRPMPGRYYRAGIQVQFLKTQKSTNIPY